MHERRGWLARPVVRGGIRETLSSCASLGNRTSGKSQKGALFLAFSWRVNTGQTLGATPFLSAKVWLYSIADRCRAPAVGLRRSAGPRRPQNTEKAAQRPRLAQRPVRGRFSWPKERRDHAISRRRRGYGR